jgi:hypothetical protein
MSYSCPIHVAFDCALYYHLVNFFQAITILAGIRSISSQGDAPAGARELALRSRLAGAVFPGSLMTALK